MFDQEKLKQIVEKNPFCKEMEMELLEVRQGFAKGRMPLGEKNLNMYGGMHGGCSYALADTVAGLCASSYGYYVTTLNSAMNYLLPIQRTKYVYCEAKVVRHGKKIGVYDFSLLNDDGAVLCTGTFTYYVLNKIEDL